MYRLLAAIALFNLASAHFWRHHDHGCGRHDHGTRGGHRHGWRHHHHEDHEFDRLAGCVISADRQVQGVCNENPQIRKSVTHGLDFYVLKYYIQQFNDEEVTVKIQHRVVSVAVGVDAFRDLRIIPYYVNASDSSWYLEDGVINVVMPYKSPFGTEAALTCGEISEEVIVVPEAANKPDDLRSL